MNFPAIENIPKYYFKRVKRCGTMKGMKINCLYRGLPAYKRLSPSEFRKGV